MTPQDYEEKVEENRKKYANEIDTEFSNFLEREGENFLSDMNYATFIFLFQKIAQLQHEINELKKSSAIINSIPSARVYGPVKNNRWKIIWKDLIE